MFASHVCVSCLRVVFAFRICVSCLLDAPCLQFVFLYPIRRYIGISARLWLDCVHQVYYDGMGLRVSWFCNTTKWYETVEKSLKIRLNCRAEGTCVCVRVHRIYYDGMYLCVL